jgi:hypothetical protein
MAIAAKQKEIIMPWWLSSITKIPIQVFCMPGLEKVIAESIVNNTFEFVSADCLILLYERGPDHLIKIATDHIRKCYWLFPRFRDNIIENIDPLIRNKMLVLSVRLQIVD